MRNTQPNYVHSSPWDDDIKVEARYKTIIKIYRKVFRRLSIPEDSEYWTMCGAHYTRTSSIMGELGHLVNSNLIHPDQFYGVDREEKVIKTNAKYYPHIKWIHGDFLETICKRIIDKQFNPSIINYDGVMQPKYGSDYLKKIMKTIDNGVKNELLLISNFVLKNPYTFSEKSEFQVNDIFDILLKEYWIPDHWSVYPQGYPYKHGKTQMGTVIFIKKPHDPLNITYTKGRNLLWKEKSNAK